MQSLDDFLIDELSPEPAPTETALTGLAPTGTAPEPAEADRALTCRECGAEFPFTAGEQAFYRSRGFTREPSRCPDCRTSRRKSPRHGEPREATATICAGCGILTSVPLRSAEGRPFYCRECHAVRQS